MTLRERFGELRPLKVAFVGDGFNMAQSWIEAAAAIAGCELRIGCPPKATNRRQEFVARLRKARRA